MVHNNISEDFTSPFTDGEYGDGIKPYTLFELDIMKVLCEIKNKVNWYQKIKSDEIRDKWIKELSSKFSETVIKYAIDELIFYIDNSPEGKLLPGPVDRTYVSDSIIPTNLQEDLINHVSKLENVPEKELDWHPGSKKQVLDLVHPSLFPVVFGETRVITDNIEPGEVLNWKSVMGTGSIDNVKFKPKIESSGEFRYYNDFSLDDSYYSFKYQWLPTEIEIFSNGKAKILSYINNLHPDIHKELYTTLEKIFERIIPLINCTLTDSTSSKLDDHCERIGPSDYFNESFDEYAKRICISEGKLSDDQKKELETTGDIKDFKLEYDYRNKIYDRYDKEKIVEPPKDIVFDPSRILDGQKQINLNNTRLQVIVKLANIILTPDNPKYEGGVWHVEGMQNENIVSSSIYYYDQENISESQLDFRVSISEPDYEQDDIKGVLNTYGLVDDCALVQNIGHINTLKNRCITFPNIYQHKVQPFELLDKTKPGFRKILCFFLVDPSKRIISTAIVPPQQKSWFEIELKKSENKNNKLPFEIPHLISKKLGWPMSLDTAKSHREKLMEERKVFFSVETEEIFERPFSLCEH
ncbi:hypothetical protein AYI69_g2794 [Smittium culicis]|uniref:Uncharacterized protein n=1 Tax=Smittium culicis TaxID=133412 RepID=A0A1R1YLM1_9FUNG|nr:hypothetical protein AYI69_g2794 [Smittium culicis]